jgi:hypothetical protein
MSTSPPWLAQVHTIYRSATMPCEGLQHAPPHSDAEASEQILLSAAIQMLAKQLGTELGKE